MSEDSWVRESNCPEQRMVLVGAEDRRLEDARPVPDEEEADLAARALVVDPAADLDVLVLVGRDVLDVNPFHDAQIIGQTPSPRKPCSLGLSLLRRPRRGLGDRLRSLR